MDSPIDFGIVNRKSDLPSGLISRSEASQYVDVNTLAPMLPLIDEAGLVKYCGVCSGRFSEYLDISEAQKWGLQNGYDFWPSHEISSSWRHYIQTLDRIYDDVERLKVLAEKMEFTDEECVSIPRIDRKGWLWSEKPIVLRDPRIREGGRVRRRWTTKVTPLGVFKSLERRYKLLRKKMAALDNGKKRVAPLTVHKSGNRFQVRLQRKIFGEKIKLSRSFVFEADAIQWATEISEELSVLSNVQQTDAGALEIAPGSLSKLLLDPSEYLKAGSRYILEMANKVVATETPSTEGAYVSPADIHAHSVLFEDTIVCGIYFLIGEGEIVYVGQSVDIFKRLREHVQGRYKKWDRFSMIPVRQEKLTEVETWYIQHFRPKYNKNRRWPHKSEASVEAIRVETEARLRRIAKAQEAGLSHEDAEKYAASHGSVMCKAITLNNEPCKKTASGSAKQLDPHSWKRLNDIGGFCSVHSKHSRQPNTYDCPSFLKPG